jgi:trigger factor
MKTSVEKTDTLGRKLSIEVPQENVASAFDRVYRQIQKNANIKGFRKGKAPLDMIKSLYSDKVRSDVLQDLVSEGYAKALSEHKLAPISNPDVKFDDLHENKGFQFTAEIEIRPEIKIKKYEKLKVEKEKLNVGPDRIDKILENIRGSRAEQVPVFEDRAVKTGDIAEIDFTGTMDGAPLQGGDAKNYKIEIGSNSLIPGFEDGIIGMKPGSSKDIHLNFPTDYGNAELAGKPVSFAIQLHKILANRLPELNDEFAKSLGGVDSLDALKAQIQKDLEAEESGRIQTELKSRILKALTKENPVDVPKGLLVSQRAALVKDVEKRIKDQGASDADLEEYKTKWSSDIDENAAFMIQSSFLVDQLATDLKLSATEKEIDDRITSYAATTGIELEKIKKFYSDSSRRNQLEYQITEEKVVGKLIELADIKEVSADQLKK